jgi:SAM-dependent methyltransferase
VLGIDLSEGSLAIARRRKKEGEFANVEFDKMDILTCSLPNDYSDYSYSVGVLHHTGAPFQGFKQLVRVTKPGGTVIVSLYNKYSRRVLRMKQTLCKWLGRENIDKRVKWAKKLFGGTLRKLDKRYHGLNTEEVAYDIFGFPHESLHSAHEVLHWFDRTGVEYRGSFAPLRVTDYFYAFSLPEYASFRSTFAGFPGMRLTADAMRHMSKAFGHGGETIRSFPRPSDFSTIMVQTMWIPFGLRFNCFTVSGIKRG